MKKLFFVLGAALICSPSLWSGGSRPGEGGRQIVPDAYRILDHIEGEPASIEAIAIREDRSEMVVGGYVTRNGGRQLLLGRYNLNRALGSNGHFVIDVIGSEDEKIFDVALDNQNRIVAAGFGNFGGHKRCVVMRFHYDGRPEYLIFMVNWMPTNPAMLSEI